MASDQRWDPEAYARNARFVSDLGAGVVELLAAKAGERILDLGCGDGALTRTLAEAGCRVVGVDGSPGQVAAARALGLDARVGSGETLAFDAEFDAVFSNAALHWMRRADLVIAGVWRALVPGGRFVGEMGGHGCVEHIRRALIAALDRRGLDGTAADPWYFPTAEDYRALLEAQGFRVDMMNLFARPTPLPGDVVGWLEIFAQSFTAALPVAERPAFLTEVRDTLRPALCDVGGRWTADYVRLRFAAVKPR
jgi:trans-aconitate methyltransferase